MAHWKARIRLLIGGSWTFFAICYGSAAMKPNLCKMCVFDRGYATCQPNFRLKGYVSRWSLWTVALGNDCTTTLLLKVFCQRNLVADFIQLKLSFIQKRQSSLFEPAFDRLRDNVNESPCRFPIRSIWTFSLALTVETLQAELCRRDRFLKVVGQFGSPFQVEGDVAHLPLLGGKKLDVWVGFNVLLNTL